jgi:GH25 family lysozyme M1 (1,4-beta-N-acetylmuramidase)
MKVLKPVSLWKPIAFCLLAIFFPQLARAQRPLGIDVSKYQGSGNVNGVTNIIWPSVKGDGITFSFARSTEGTNYFDPDFPYNITNAKAAGIVIGSYHFARYDQNPGLAGADAEADYCWSVISNYITNDGMSISPMLDLEHATNTDQSTWANEWCHRIITNAASLGVVLHPIIYTNPNFAANNLKNKSITQWTLWMADVTQATNPQTLAPPTAPWPDWSFFQYATTIHVAGVSGDIDRDVFHGPTNLLLSSYIVGNAPPQNTNVPAGSNATFIVTASQPGPIYYQWSFNQAAIAGATNSSLTISNAQPANSGPYSVNVANTNGTLFTATASLGIISPLTNTPGAVLAPANMVSWWPGDGNGNDIFGSNNLTAFNSVNFTTGEQGGAFHFDGTSYCSNGVSSLPVPWTACVWVNRQNAPKSGAALTGDGLFEIKLEQFNGTRDVGITKFGVVDNRFTPLYSVPVNTWTHLAFVGTSTNTLLYVNGILQSTLAMSLSLPRTYIGVGYVTSTGAFVDYMAGSLDEFMIFSRALDATEINSIYQAGSSGLVRAPAFTGMKLAGPGQFQLNLEGQTGKNYTVYSSTDLIDWTTLGSISNPAGTNTFTDFAATNAQAFYRVSQP